MRPSLPSLRSVVAVLPALSTALLLSPPPAAHAQSGLGAAVAVSGPDEVVVLRPGAQRGPSAAIVFRRGPGGGWGAAEQLTVLEGGYPGETLTAPVTAGGDLLLLGGGDPDGRVAGHLYQRAGDGWAPAGRVAADPAAGLPLPRARLDMATLSALMAPPARAAALSPDGTLLAVAGGADPGVVRLLRRGADGGWSVEAELRGGAAAPEGTPEEGGGEATQFGAALALDRDRLLVGAPEEGVGGAAWVFERRDGAWTRTGHLASDSVEASGRLGAAVAFAGAEALVAAPERDRVVRFAPADDGGWARVGVLAPGAGDDGPSRFGHALAATPDRLLVGAPLAGGLAGAVHRYERADGGWRHQGTLAAPAAGRGAAFGWAVALGGDRAVVGAPGADGGRGRALAYDLAGGGDPVALDPGDELRAVTGAEPVRCEEGEAAGFACDGVDLVSFLPLSALGARPGEALSDLWGWTDPETGREYAIAGRTAGFAFVDVTDPGSPRYLGLLPANPSGARDIKVYRDHAFMTGDGAGDHGLLVFDLTRLREVGGEGGGEGMATPATFAPDARYDLVASAHNLVVDTESGFAYTVGTNTGGQSCGGGLHMIDIREPLEPTFAGCYTDTEGLIWAGRSHDAQCTVYRGPDEAYQGRQICFASNETALRIVDVTDKANPVPVAAVSHPGTAYIHQGWLTEDHRYLYVNDELDEIVGTTDRTRTLVWDVAELDDPILVAEHLGPDRATDHNLYIEGDRAYLANYHAGFRVLDVSDPEHPVEVGWFDTTPYGENPPGFLGGAWTAYPFFESGMVVVSSQHEGLFILRPRPGVLP